MRTSRNRHWAGRYIKAKGHDPMNRYYIRYLESRSDLLLSQSSVCVMRTSFHKGLVRWPLNRLRKYYTKVEYVTQTKS